MNILRELVLTLIISLTAADFRSATSTESCSNILLHLVKTKGPIACHEIFDWAICYVRVSGLDKRVPNDEDIIKFAKELKGNLDLLSLECGSQVQIILRALETPEGVRQKVYVPSVYTPTQAANQPTQQDFRSATSTESCSNILLHLVKTKGPIACHEIFDWAMCYVRVSGLDTRAPNDEDVIKFAKELKGNLDLLSLECGIQVQIFLGELKKLGGVRQKVYAPSVYIPTQAENQPTQQGCLLNTADACANRPDGDYPACSPLCEKGVYITCTNQLKGIRSCALGWFKIPNTSPLVGRFRRPLVYNPDTYSCLQASPSCPRDLDYQLETGK